MGLARIFALSEAMLGKHLATKVGTRQDVLVEGPAKRAFEGGADGATFTGRTAHNEIVHVDDPAMAGLVGEIVPVTIARSLKHSLVGEIDPELRARAAAALPVRAPSPRTLPLVR